MKKLFVGLLFSFSFIGTQQSYAEYRVFRLKITKKAQQPQSPAESVAPASPPPSAEERIVESTLDPEQYRSYYPLQADEEISYTETWRCYGRTGGETPFCPQPQRQPSSAETKSQNPSVNPPSAP